MSTLSPGTKNLMPLITNQETKLRLEFPSQQLLYEGGDSTGLLCHCNIWGNITNTDQVM